MVAAASLTLLLIVGQRPSSDDLIRAIRKHDSAAVERLLRLGADATCREAVVEAPSIETDTAGGRKILGDTALMIATDEGVVPIVRALLKKGADVNSRGVAGFTAFFEAVRRRRLDLVRLFLQCGAKVDQANDYGDTPLIFAANEGQIPVIEILLKHGARINGGRGATPLQEAVASSQTEAVRYLLLRGADPNYHRPGYPTPLASADSALDEIKPLLIKAGARQPGAVEKREAAAAAAKVRADWAAERRARDAEIGERAKRFAAERIPTGEDARVVEAVLLDYLKQQPVGNGEGTTVGLGTQTAGDYNSFTDNEVTQNATPDAFTNHAKDVTIEMRRQLRRRNSLPVALDAWKFASPLIRLRKPAELSGVWHMRRKTSDRGWLVIWLPAYSADGRLAVLHFLLGPTAHGATGTYFLEKRDGSWIIKWKGFSLYV